VSERCAALAAVTAAAAALSPPACARGRGCCARLPGCRLGSCGAGWAGGLKVPPAGARGIGRAREGREPFRQPWCVQLLGEGPTGVVGRGGARWARSSIMKGGGGVAGRKMSACIRGAQQIKLVYSSYVLIVAAWVLGVCVHTASR
jgi:hypothetical protein